MAEPVIEKIIDNDEKIIGIYYPVKKIPFKRNDWIKIPFIIVWTAFFILIFTLLSFSSYFSNFIFSIMAMGAFYATIGRFIWARFKISFIVYLVTDKRIIIYSKLFRSKKSLSYKNFPKMTLKSNNDDYGYIIFGKPVALFDGGGMEFKENKYIFDNLRNVSVVYDIITKSLHNYNQTII